MRFCAEEDDVMSAKAQDTIGYSVDLCRSN